VSQILCLIADPARAPLQPPMVAEVGRAVGASPHWLAEAEACEFALEDAARGALAGPLRQTLEDACVDVALVPAAADRVKRLLVSDMDSTVITVECIDELAGALGIQAEVAAITRRAMNGELDFRTALAARVALLAGLPVTVLDEVYRERVRLMPGAATLVRTMRARGATTALVSGGFAPFTERVRAALGFDLVQANRLQTSAGRLTGRVLEPVRGPQSKLALLMRLARARKLASAATLAVGDGANDLPMLEAAGLGVAYRAHPVVRAAIPVAINHGNLTALLYLQGIARRDFVLA
jgi:phosphoserine phosphatase